MAAEERGVALVTGASSGIGRAYAERLAGLGHDLVVVARRRERLEELAERLPVAVQMLVADLTTPEGVRDVEGLIAGEPRLSLLVNNAGFGGYAPFAELDPDEAERLIQINVTTPARLTRAALPGMIERGRGAVVNLASLFAFAASLPPDPLPHRATYAACKSFVVAFATGLSHELRGTGVQVQALCPGLVESEFHHARPIGGVPQMPAEDVVTASLRGLELGEVICCPTLVDTDQLSVLDGAGVAMFASGRTATLAPRYREG